MLKKIVILVILGVSLVNAENLKIASAAGYKKPILKIVNEYKKNVSHVDAFFGNMKQVTAQANSTNMALVLGDKNYLKNKSKLSFKKFIHIGEGKAVIAYPKGGSIKSILDLKNKNIKRIAIAQPKKAIYGIAGEESLRNVNLYNEVKDKLYIVNSVPQVVSYVIANEVDAGIINLTSALINKDKIGGYLIIDEKNYTKINIVVGVLEDCKTDECKNFLNFLQSDFSKKVFKKYGL